MRAARDTNPFSAQRAASPDMFFGYGGQLGRPLGVWKLEEITACWLQCDDGIPSFWAVGERKMGKTSLLLRLENLLSPQNTRDAPRMAVPLYISCENINTLEAFYRELLGRAVQILGVDEASAAPVIDAGQLRLLGHDSGRALTPFELLDYAVEDLGNIVAQLSGDDGPRARIVLLIDEVGGAVARGWTSTLFEHLRTMLRGRPSLRSPGALRREDVAVVIAGDRSLEKVKGARCLLELLEELPLRTLDASEVASLITEHCELRSQRHFWPHRIYRATAGHPWLVQFVMENIVAASGKNTQEQEPDLDAIVKTRFRTLKDGMETFRLYLDSLSERSVEILAQLALGDGSTVATLAARTSMSAGAVTRRLEQMLNLGIVCQTPVTEAQEAESRYFLGEIFKSWFVAHTGSAVLLAEIEELRSAANRERTQIQVLNAPFTLTLGMKPDFLLADGLYTRLLRLKNDLAKTLNKISKLVRNEGQKDFLDIVADDLKDALQQDEWEPVWNDYVEKASGQGRDARFVLRVHEPELFDFPIEIISFNNRPLGLERPVYKELMAGQREPAYRLSRNLLLSEPLNVLVVGSSRGGKYDDRSYPDLPLVESEVTEICRALLASGSEQRLAIGRVVALVETAGDLPQGVQKHAPSAANLAKALGGELGGPFHLLHYCGHYVPGREAEGGFLLHDGAALQLFNLSAWRNALVSTKLRLVCLSACGSGVHVPDASLYHFGAAHAALTTGVPAVIGMRWSIRDSHAYDFSRAFYPHLLKSGVPEIALFETRRELQANNSASTLWAAPVMLTR